ncbi:hypothetical protein [Sedimenticola selenatireducens]|uniref:hypothetical protein n=1 Tax=Sedimenticola selenatireducens TaxID=191960 RepID=UPI00048B796C|nr:hypothetical protein [Sedimenticola selenatireducens]
MTDEHGLFVERELEKLDKRRREILEQHTKLLETNAYLIQWGQVVSAMLADGGMTPDEWSARCFQYLEGERLDIALKGLKNLD